jgi:hypothetical protein
MQGLRIDPDAAQDSRASEVTGGLQHVQHLCATVAGSFLHRRLGTTIDQTTPRT